MCAFNSIDFIWSVCIEFLYRDKELYAGSLSKILKENNSDKILDCSCGTGFPSIQLAKNDFNLTCSDASNKMLSGFKKNMEKQSLLIPTFNLKWKHLDSFFKQEFDAVLCRGNSLPYCVSWEKNSVDLNKAGKEILVSLRNMFNVLKKGGMLYIDLSPREAFSPLNTTFIHKFGPKIIDGKKIVLDWKIQHFLEEKRRVWDAVVSVENEKNFPIHLEGYHLRHSELISMLKEIGFKKIRSYAEVEGEKTYDVFLAFK